MDFDLTDDQVALRDGARDLLDDYASAAGVRAHSETEALFDAACWDAMVEQGWLGIDVVVERGGVGLGTVEVGVLAEVVGAHVAPVPFLANVLAIGALDRAGDPRATDLLDGTRLGCVAWSATPPRAARTGEAWELTGGTDPVVAGPGAALAVVIAADDEGEAVFAVELGGDRHIAREPAMDLTRCLGWLHLDCTRATRLGGPDAARQLFDRAVAFRCCEMLGTAQRVLELATEYAKDRVQFGRPIGSFQAVKHRCADMLVDVEGMRSTAMWAAWAVGVEDQDASVAASTAKTWCSDAARRVMAGGLQVHGGIGFTWEHDLHFFLKRSQLDQFAFGDAAFHRRRLTALLRPRVEAGETVV